MHTTSFLENLVFSDPLSDLCLFAAITAQWSEYRLVIVTGILMPLRKFNLFPDIYGHTYLFWHRGFIFVSIKEQNLMET